MSPGHNTPPLRTRLTCPGFTKSPARARRSSGSSRAPTRTSGDDLADPPTRNWSEGRKMRRRGSRWGPPWTRSMGCTRRVSSLTWTHGPTIEGRAPECRATGNSCLRRRLADYLGPSAPSGGMPSPGADAQGRTVLRVSGLGPTGAQTIPPREGRRQDRASQDQTARPSARSRCSRRRGPGSASPGEAPARRRRCR